MKESRDPTRPRSIDFAGTVLIAVVLVPLVLAFSKGAEWGWVSPGTIICLVISVLGGVGFVIVEQRVAAPLVDLALLRNPILVGATLAILIVAGAINALMYLLSLYFQDPATFGMSALEAGLATLPAAAAMIAVTPLITPLAVRIGSATRSPSGSAWPPRLAALVFVRPSWSYAAFVCRWSLAVGLGLANGPASSASTAASRADEVGQASGISNMARYVGGSLAVAAAATIYSSVTTHHSTKARRRRTRSPPASRARRSCWRSSPPPASRSPLWSPVTAPSERGPPGGGGRRRRRTRSRPDLPAPRPR